MSANNELVYVNCFYYGFYINKSELDNYSIKPEQLVKDTKKIIKDYKKVEYINNVEESETTCTSEGTKSTERPNVNYYIYDLSKSIYNYSIVRLLNCNNILVKLSKYEFNIIR